MCVQAPPGVLRQRQTTHNQYLTNVLAPVRPVLPRPVLPATGSAMVNPGCFLTVASSQNLPPTHPTCATPPRSDDGNLAPSDGRGPHSGADGGADPAPMAPDAVANDEGTDDAADNLPMTPLHEEAGGDDVEAHPGTGHSDMHPVVVSNVVDIEGLVGGNAPTPFSRPSCTQVHLQRSSATSAMNRTLQTPGKVNVTSPD